MARPISWSDLPRELLVSIAKLLDTYEDIVRIRAVCSSWRFFISPPVKKIPLPLVLPLADYYPKLNTAENVGYFTLSADTIYRLDSPSRNESLSLQQHGDTTGSSCRRNGWLVRVQQTDFGKLRALNPFGGRIDFFPPPQSTSKVLNSLDFLVSEMTKGYSLQFVGMGNDRSLTFHLKSVPDAHQLEKVVVSSKPVSTADDYVVLVLNEERVLRCIKLGDDRWTVMDTINYRGRVQRFFPVDILEYKGKFFLVGKNRKIFILNYSLEVTETFMSPTCEDCPCILHFVESNGDLFLVHKRWYDIYNNRIITDKPFKIKVYKLDDEQRRWSEETNLGDSVLFVCHDCCFAISAQDFRGLKGNCVYFTHDFTWEFAKDAICKGFKDFPIYVFSLEDGSVGPLVSHPDNSSILWSIPS